MKFCTAKRSHLPVDPDKFDVNRCNGNESPLRREKPDFWPVSKFNTGTLPLRGILPVTTLGTSFISYVDICYLKFELLDIQVRKLSKMLVYYTMKCTKLVLATAMVYSYVYFT